MRIIKLKGGLGNQMFQYAFAKVIQHLTGDEVKIDLSSYGSLEKDSVRVPRIIKYNLSLSVATEQDADKICFFSHRGNSQKFGYRLMIAAEALLNKKYYFERDRQFRSPEALKDFRYFDGYWQSWKYVDMVWDELQRDFLPKFQLSSKTFDAAARMDRENSVFVGIRRGDYLKEKDHYGTFSQAYYDNAMAYMDAHITAPVYYIFSNDIEWVKNNMYFGNRTIVYRDDPDMDDFEELYLMSHCRHAIIVNSTFHWWGARLQDREDKIVVAPKKWFFDESKIDIVPSRWVRM